MNETKRKLPAKCVDLKAAYLPATKWWCSFCVPTGGNVCYPICLMIGKQKPQSDKDQKNKINK